MADDPRDVGQDARPWTRPDEYVVALARRRTARRSRSPGSRTQPESPRFALSTLPFLLLMAALAVIAGGIFLAAWPHPPAEKPSGVETREQGTAKRGWLDDAKREFHD